MDRALALGPVIGLLGELGHAVVPVGSDKIRERVSFSCILVACEVSLRAL